MKARELMTQPPQTCAPDSRRLKQSGCGTLVVVDGRGRTVGILTDRDLALAVGDRRRNAAAAPVATAMSHGVHSCQPDDDLEQVVQRMSAARVRRLPVINAAGDLKGVISIDDIILWAVMDGTVPAADVIDALRTICHAHWPAAEYAAG
jgi:CBS domain-containing protein